MFKKDIFIVVLLLAFIPNLFAQNKVIKEGAYRNLYEFHQNNPFLDPYEIEINVDRSVRKEYYFLTNKSNKNIRSLRKRIWGVYKDSCFYINYSRIGIKGSGFAKVKGLGRFSFINGNPAMTADQKDRMWDSWFYYGLIGTAITNLNVLNENSAYYHLLDLKTGVPKPITVEYIMFILKREEDLLEHYQFEQDKESLEIILKYVRKLNSRIAIY